MATPIIALVALNTDIPMATILISLLLRLQGRSYDFHDKRATMRHSI